MKVFLDSGHGGTIFGKKQTAGKGNVYGYVEGMGNRHNVGKIYDQILASSMVRNELKGGIDDFNVVDLIGNCNMDVPMKTRIAAVNSVCSPEDIYLGIHTNAASNTGTWQTKAHGARFIYYRSSSGVESKRGKDLAEYLAKGWPHRKGAQVVKPFGKNLYMLRNSKCPAVILELAFHDNEEDLMWLQYVGADLIAKHLRNKIFNLGL